jgi:hypothetical protein
MVPHRKDCTMRTLLTAAALGLAAAVFTPAGHAAWLGLQDGDYVVTLSCDFSNVIACPGSSAGTLSLAGGETTAMSFTVNGQLFAGDPLDDLVDGPTIGYESASIQLAPYAFLSLRLMTAGELSPYGPGDRWWVYCNNINATQCAPGTFGTWSARALNAVPEPASLALAALALAALSVAAPRRRSSARS